MNVERRVDRVHIAKQGVLVASDHWVNVVIAGIGMIGALAAGAFGYQSGSNAVNKDYVALAISTLDKKDASPELRKWSVDVLGTLSPVPFNSKLKEELTASGLQRQRYIYTAVSIPKFATELCPNILPKLAKEVSDLELRRLVTEYEVCRVKYEDFLKFIRAHNKIMADANAEQDKIEANFRQRIGLPPEAQASEPSTR